MTHMKFNFLILLIALHFAEFTRAKLLDLSETTSSKIYESLTLKAGDSVRFRSQGRIFEFELGKDVSGSSGVGSRAFQLPPPNEHRLLKILRGFNLDDVFSFEAEKASLDAHREIGIQAPEVYLISERQEVMIKDFADGDLGTVWLDKIEQLSFSDQMQHIFGLDKLYSAYKRERYSPNDLKPNNFTFKNSGEQVMVFDPGPMSKGWAISQYYFGARTLSGRFTGLVLWHALQYFKIQNPQAGQKELNAKVKSFVDSTGGSNRKNLFRFLYIETDKTRMALRKYIINSAMYFKNAESKDYTNIDSGDMNAFFNEIRDIVLTKKSFDEIIRLREHLKALRLPNLSYAFNQSEVAGQMNSFKVAAWRRKLIGSNESEALHPALRNVLVGKWKLNPGAKAPQCAGFYKN